MWRSHLSVGLTLLVAAGSWGCRADPATMPAIRATPDSDGATIDELAAAVDIAPEPLTVAPAELMPSRTVRGVFRRMSDDGVSRDIRFVLEPTDDGWVLTIDRLRREFYALSAVGELVVRREDDFVEDARVEYDPALVVLPRDRVRAAGRSAMTVYDLAGKRRRDRGHVDYEVEVVGRRRLDTAAGPFEAVLVRTRRAIDLSLADVEVAGVDAYAAGQGPVAEQTRREIRALGLFSDRSASRLERAD